MDLFRAVQKIVGDYLHGEVSLRDLHHWLAAQAQDIADDPRDEAATLSEAVWTAISRLGDGEIDEAAVRSSLTVALRRTQLSITALGQDCQTATAATIVTVEVPFSAPALIVCQSVPISRSPILIA